jgi:hypothetical protein
VKGLYRAHQREQLFTTDEVDRFINCKRLGIAGEITHADDLDAVRIVVITQVPHLAHAERLFQCLHCTRSMRP